MLLKYFDCMDFVLQGLKVLLNYKYNFYYGGICEVSYLICDCVSCSGVT